MMPEVRFHHISADYPAQSPSSNSTRAISASWARVIALGEGQIVFTAIGRVPELFQPTAAAPIAPADGDGYPWPASAIFRVDINVEAKLAAMQRRERCSDRSVLTLLLIPGRRIRVAARSGRPPRAITHGITDQTDPPPLRLQHMTYRPGTGYNR
jgi:hypothetical protein